MALIPVDFDPREQAPEGPSKKGASLVPVDFDPREQAEQNRRGYSMRRLGSELGTVVQATARGVRSLADASVRKTASDVVYKTASSVVHKTADVARDQAAKLSQEVAPGNRLETVGRSIARAVLSLTDVIPLAINMTNRAAGAVAGKGQPTHAQRKQGAKGSLLPQPLIGGDVPYISDMVLGESQGPIETAASFIGPAALEKAGAKYGTRLLKYYGESKLAKADEAAGQVTNMRQFNTDVKRAEGLRQQKLDEAIARRSLGREQYHGKVTAQISKGKAMLKQAEVEANTNLQKKIAAMKDTNLNNKSVLEATQFVQNMKSKQAIEAMVDGVGGHLSGKYDTLFDEAKFGSEIVPGVTNDLGQLLSRVGEDITEQNKGGLVNSLRSFIKNADAEDAVGQAPNTNVDSLIKKLNPNQPEFTMSESDALKRILQEYRSKLFQKASTKGMAQDVGQTVDSIVGKIDNIAQTKLPKTEAINYRQLNSDYVEYIKMRDNGKLLYAGDKYKGSAFVDDILEAQTTLLKHSRTQDPEVIAQGLRESSRAFDQYMTAAEAARKHGLVPEAEAMEKHLMQSFTNKGNIDTVTAMLTDNPATFSQEDLDAIQTLKNSVVQLVQEQRGVKSADRLQTKRIKVLRETRNTKLESLDKTTQDAIDAIEAKLDPVQRSYMYHILGTTSYAAALLPPGVREVVKSVGFVVAMKEFAPPAMAKTLGGVLAKTRTLPILRNAALSAQTVKLLQGYFQYLDNPTMGDQ